MPSMANKPDTDLTTDPDPKLAEVDQLCDSSVPEGSDTVFLTERALAERWHLSMRTLQRWRAGRRAPDHLVIGNRILYPVARVLAFEQRRMRQGEGS